MNILATVTKEDGNEVSTVCHSWAEYAAWVESFSDWVEARTKEITQEKKE